MLAGSAASAVAASPLRLSWSSPWLADDSLPFGDLNPLSSVSCPSVSLCVAVDNVGQVVTSTDPAGGSSSWTAALIDRLGVVEDFGSGVAGVSCPSVSLCVAVEGNGDVLTSTDPTGGGDAWRVVHLDEPTPRELTGVSCPSVSLCVAVGNDAVIDSSNPTGGASAWTTVQPAEVRQLSGVSCPSQSLCVAVGSGVLISTDPTGGASTWMSGLAGEACPSQGPSQSLCLAENAKLEGVACPSRSLCVAVSGNGGGPGNESGEVFTSTDPTEGFASWHLSAVDHERRVTSVSCASASLCVAVDNGGNAFTATDATSGTPSWTAAQVDMPAKIYCRCDQLAVSCPSASLCVAVDINGNVITSTDPAAGAASTWAPPVTVDADDGLDAMSCPSVTRCYALDSAGRIVTSSSPSVSGQPWSAFPVTNLANRPLSWTDQSYAAVNCPARLSLCVASDLTPIGFKGHYETTMATSSHPSYGPQAWKPTSSGFLADGISCPSRRLCVGATSNDIVTSTRPAVASSWILHGVEPAGRLITAVVCPTVQLCVAVDSRGDVLTSTHPAGPARLWRIKHVDPTKGSVGRQSALYTVSCPTRKLCISFDSDGNLLFSTRPTGGTGAWKLVHLPGAAEAQDMTCPSTSLCVGLDDGNVATVTNPSRRNAAWTVTPVDPDSYLLSLSCPSASLCIAGDTHGNVLVGRPSS